MIVLVLVLTALSGLTSTFVLVLHRKVQLLEQNQGRMYIQLMDRVVALVREDGPDTTPRP